MSINPIKIARKEMIAWRKALKFYNEEIINEENETEHREVDSAETDRMITQRP